MSVELPMRFEDHELMWLVDDVYTPEECDQKVRFIEEHAPRLASYNTGYRDQDRVMIDDHDDAANLFERLAPYLPATLGPFTLRRLNERFRYYRYAPGQRFSPHMDHWYRPSETEITLLTILVYFNDAFEGGETRFMEQHEALVEPKPGRVAIFQHKIRHEGCMVVWGTKYAMRTEAIYDAPDTIGVVTF